MSLTLNALESTPLHLMTHEEGVRFPEGALPHQSPVYVRNSLVIPAAPERLFAWLLAAPRWPEWYANAKDVRIAGDAPLLTLGAEFTWVTFGVPVHTRIEELVPARRLAWSGRGLGSTAYHGWLLEPVAEGTRVTTEETQRGFVATIGRVPLRRGLLKWHQRWLEGLAQISTTGLPAV